GFMLLLPNIVIGLIVLAIMVVIGVAAKWAIWRWARRRGRENLGEVAGSFAKWTIAFIGFLVFLTIVLPSVQPVDLLAGFGVGSIAIGFAFKDILQNWLAGLLILMRQPFVVGDQIVIDG